VRLLATASAVVACLFPVAAAAAAKQITEYGAANGLAAAAQPSSIIAGADGNLWFTDISPTPAIGRITPTGAISELTPLNSALSPTTYPGGLVLGPDGNVWFTSTNTSAPAIGRVTPAGTVTEFSSGLDSGARAETLAAGPGGTLWFTDQGSTPAIGRITTAGAITESTHANSGLDSGSMPDAITAGPDGNMWFTDQNGAIGRITPAGVITEFTPANSDLDSGSSPVQITIGPDGNLWFTDRGSTPAIGRITPAGVVTEFTHANSGLDTDSLPWGIIAGADGNLWFTDEGNSPAIGRVTPSGAVTEFTGSFTATSYPSVIVAGADGDLWVLNGAVNAPAVDRVTPDGTITELGSASGLNADGAPRDLVSGPDGNLWFTDDSAPAAVGRAALELAPAAATGAASAISATSASVAGTVNPLGGAVSAVSIQYGTTAAYGSRASAAPGTLPAGGVPVAISSALEGLPGGSVIHYRVDATNAFGTSNGADRTLRTLPGPALSLTGLRQSARRWREGTGGGTTFSFSLNQSAEVRLAFAAVAPGRRAGKRCVAPNRHNRHQRSCTRISSKTALSVPGRSGVNRVRFAGRVDGGRALKPGSYVVTVVGTTTADKSSKPQTLRFTIAAKRRSAR
jgi:streptogramin lyase